MRISSTKLDKKTQCNAAQSSLRHYSSIVAIQSLQTLTTSILTSSQVMGCVTIFAVWGSVGAEPMHGGQQQGTSLASSYLGIVGGQMGPGLRAWGAAVPPLAPPMSQVEWSRLICICLSNAKIIEAVTTTLNGIARICCWITFNYTHCYHQRLARLLPAMSVLEQCQDHNYNLTYDSCSQKAK